MAIESPRIIRWLCMSVDSGNRGDDDRAARQAWKTRHAGHGGDVRHVRQPGDTAQPSARAPVRSRACPMARRHCRLSTTGCGCPPTIAASGQPMPRGTRWCDGVGTGWRCGRRGLAGRVRADRVRDPGDPHPRALRRPGGDAVDPAHPDPARAGRGVRSRRYARVLGVPGVCSTTTGPGTFNTLAAVAEAWSDSSPVVVLAGQIDAALDGLGHGVLHETPDQGRSFEALTAFTGRPRTTAAIPAAVGEALRCSMTGRRRPAYVELPTDLLLQPYEGDVPAVEFPGPVVPDPAAVVDAARVLSGASRVVIMPGAGVHRARASAELRRLAIRLDAPVITQITGAGAIPADDTLWAGVLNPGREECRALLEAADVVLVVGCRLDDVQTGRWTLPLGTIVQIDVDPGRDRGRSYPVAAGIVGRCPARARRIARRTGRGAQGRGVRRVRRRGRASARHSRGTLTGVSADERKVRDAFLAARAALPRDAILTHDAARLNSWTGYIWPVYEPDGSMFPWGSATLGFALGAANGAAVAAPGRRVVASCGDGGFLFTAMELATAVAHQLDVTVFIHDDSAFGSIADYQREAARPSVRDRPRQSGSRGVRPLVRCSGRARRGRRRPARRDDPRHRRSRPVGRGPWRPARAAVGQRQAMISSPPWMSTLAPVMYAASSEARKHTSEAISEGSASRPNGIEARTLAIRASSVEARTIGVSTIPGEMALTVMPVARPFAGQVAGQPEHASLGRRVVDATQGARRPAGHRGEIDDPPVSRVAQHRIGRLGAQERTGQVGVDHEVPLLGRDVGGPRGAQDARRCSRARRSGRSASS